MSLILRVVAIVAMVLHFTFLPFLPGRYDSFAAPLSGMAQLFGVASLLLVPVGLVWLALGRRREPTGQKPFIIAAAVVAVVPWLVVAMLMPALGNFSILVLALTVLVLFVAAVRRSLGDPASWTPDRGRVVALSLVIAPIVTTAIQLGFVERMVNASRERAMRNAAELIGAIEAYRAANGRYPTSLLAEIPDYKPGVIGIPFYMYEPHGEAYNVVFEQTSNRLGTREFVVYNPRDEGVFTAHARDILELTPAQLVIERTRGHNAVHLASLPHWKYFWFD